MELLFVFHENREGVLLKGTSCLGDGWELWFSNVTIYFHHHVDLISIACAMVKVEIGTAIDLMYVTF